MRTPLCAAIGVAETGGFADNEGGLRAGSGRDRRVSACVRFDSIRGGFDSVLVFDRQSRLGATGSAGVSSTTGLRLALGELPRIGLRRGLTSATFSGKPSGLRGRSVIAGHAQ